VVLLKTLEAFEQSSQKDNIGWKVIINSDEEIGSPSSAFLFDEQSDRCQLGLVFEPSLPNGHLIGARKGSGVFTLIAKGKSAHAGRNIDEGKNAIDALAQCITPISQLHRKRKGLTVNAGIVHGGIASNVVAESAMARYNIRFINEKDFEFVQENIDKILKNVEKSTGVTITCESRLSAKPKPLEGKTLDVFKHVQQCGNDLGFDIQWENSGGVCDGNRLQAAGLPTVDTLGVQGGEIHSDQEYVLLESLVERTKLATLCLLKWANDEWSI